MTNEEAAGFHPGHNPWAVALTVTIATFMEVMDTSIANVALPHIAGGLSAGQDESTWVLTSYLISNAIVLPMSAWFSERFGRKRFYMSCVALFTASSFLCGLAPSLGILVLFRVLQGIGGGGLGPSEQAILADTFPPAKRGMAFAVYGMAVVLAPAIGPTLGGWITDNYSWRWIFYVNVPFGLLSLFLTNFMVQDPPHMVKAKKESRRHPIDFTGLVLVGTGLGALQVVFDKGQREDWFSSSLITIFTIVSCAALVGFAIREWNSKYPILNLRLLRNSNFAVSNLLMLMLGGNTVRHHRADSPVLTNTNGLLGAESGRSFIAGRVFGPVNDACGRFSSFARGRPVPDRGRFPNRRVRPVPHDRSHAWNRLPHGNVVALLSGGGHGFSVRSD
jgi:MFS transporter, DHA2 family, multidrug resistance protein